MEIRTIGIDLGKTVFHFVAVNARGQIVVRKKGSRTQLLRFTANLPQCLIGMEACGGSHFLGRALREQGHDVRLMPAQYVKPYVKTNKNDYIDAEACSEAVTRPTMRFVPIKTDDQLDLQSLHRVRERWVVRRTAVINQMRGMLLERGIICGELEQCKRLVAIPGIGPITATATVAAIGNGAAFKKGRGFSAWLGVVPGEHSTGGKQKLTGTSRRGNKYLRKLFVQGAHTVLLQKTKQSSGLSTWLVDLTSRKRKQVATVALANKMARMAWAVLFKGEAYRPPTVPQVIAA